jgi:hypothetical protein
MPHLERAIEIDPEFAPAYRESGSALFPCGPSRTIERVLSEVS